MMKLNLISWNVRGLGGQEGMCQGDVWQIEVTHDDPTGGQTC